MMKTYKVAAYVQDGGYTPTQRANMYKEYEVRTKDESDAEWKADSLYYKEMGFKADTVEVI
jgi:hypothetical protein